MLKNYKIYFTFFLCLLSASVLHANSQMFTLNNHSSTLTTTSTVYVYPDASQNFYVPNYLAVNGGQCSGAPYYSCQVVISSIATLLVKQLPHTDNTKFCLSANAPSGHFQDCAPNACMVLVNNGQASLSGNCSHYTLQAQTIKTV